jgi:hypothetical protein
LSCEITHVFFCRFDAERHGLPEGCGSAWQAGSRMVGQEMALVQGAVNIARVLLVTTWTLAWMSPTPTLTYEIHTELSEQRRLILGDSLVERLPRKARQPSITSNLHPRLTRVGGGAISKQDEVQRRLVQLLVLAVATSAPAAAGDCFGNTCW